MSNDFFTWETLQLAAIGALGGALKGLSGTADTWKAGALVMGRAMLAGAIATPLFGPTMAVGIHWMFGDTFTQQNTWLLAGAITSILGVGVVGFVMTFISILAKKAGAGT